MTEHKIPTSVQQRLLKHHGEESFEAIKQNPYVPIGFGMLFTNVDKLVEIDQFNIAYCDHRRLSAALEASIRKEIKKGHTYTTQASLRPYLTKLLKNKKLTAEAFKAGYHRAQYILKPDPGTYHPTAQLLMESVVAKRLKALRSQNALYEEYADFAYKSAVDELSYDLIKKQMLWTFIEMLTQHYPPSHIFTHLSTLLLTLCQATILVLFHNFATLFPRLKKQLN